MSWLDEVNELELRRKLAKQQGGEDSIRRHHERGKLTIRERIDNLLDQGSFREHGKIAGGAELNDDLKVETFTPANYVLGLGKINQRLTAVGGEDFTSKGGSPNAAGLRRSIYAENLAVQYKVPLVRFLEGGGGSITSFSGDPRKPRTIGNPVYTDWYRGYTFGGRMPHADSVLRSGTLEAPPPYERPLNAYVHSETFLGKKSSTTEELDAIDLPIFSCPSDRTFNYQEDFWADQAEYTMSNYDAAGTSYSFNVIWQDDPNYNGKPEKARRELAEMRFKKPSRFVPILDDPAEWALWARRTNSVPHHGQTNLHSLLFFDGHSKQIEIDPNKRITTTYQVGFDEE